MMDIPLVDRNLLLANLPHLHMAAGLETLEFPNTISSGPQVPLYQSLLNQEEAVKPLSQRTTHFAKCTHDALLQLGQIAFARWSLVKFLLASGDICFLLNHVFSSFLFGLLDGLEAGVHFFQLLFLQARLVKKKGHTLSSIRNVRPL
jgi:hypothetical protein